MADQPAWDGKGTDPWMPQRLAAQAEAVAGERNIYDDYLARLSRWLVDTRRAIMRSPVVDPETVWSTFLSWVDSMTEFVHSSIADLVGTAYRKALGPGYPYSQKPHVTAYLAEAQNRLLGVPAETYDRIVGEIAVGAGMGESMDQIAKRVDGALSMTATPYWPNRAVTVARTECLVGSTPVESDGIQAVYRRWHEGPVFRVHMASGHEFTGTANHPVLTSSGWFALNELQPGDELVCHGGGQGLRATGDVHIGDVPTVLSEVYDALATVGVTIRAQTGKPDFHGDGADGYVDVAVASRELADRIEAALGQHLGNLGFEASERRPSELLGGGRLVAVDRIATLTHQAERPETPDDGVGVNPQLGGDVLGAGASRVPAHDLVGIQGQAARLSSQLGVASPQRVAGAASGNAGFLQETSDHALIHSMQAGERSLTVTSLVGFQDRGAVQVDAAEAGGLGLGARRYPRVGEYGADPALVDAEALLDAIDALTRPVGVDQVVSVDRLEFAGHVYNLSVDRGWFGVGPFYSGNTMGAMNAGRAGAFRAVAAELGETFEKMWLATVVGPASKTTRPTHRAADGQRVPLEGSFIVGGVEMDRPGDPSAPVNEVANCRCTLLMLKPGELVDLSNRQFLDY